MDHKDERLCDVLRTRIGQLEANVKALQIELQRAQEVKDELERKMEALGDEAHDVVGQWREELAATRLRLAEAERTIAVVVAAGHQKETEALAAAELSARQLEEARAALAAEQAAGAEARSQVDTLSNRLVLTERDASVANQRCAGYTCKVEQLMVEVGEAKERASAAERRERDLMARQEELLAEVMRLRTALVSAEQMMEGNIVALGESNAEVERQTRALADAKNAVATNACLIEELEGDVAEAHESIVTMKRSLETLEEQLAEHRKRGDTLEEEAAQTAAEFAAVKESYSTLLVEHSELACTLDGVRADLRLAQARCAEAIAAEARSASAANMAKYAYEQEGFFALESSARALCIIDCVVDGMVPAVSAVIHPMARAASDAAFSASTAERRVRFLEETMNVLSSEGGKLREVCEKLRSDVEGAEERISCMSREQAEVANALSAAQQLVKSMEADRDSVREENQWLRQQVESMREELGGLDELLNTNLNEMREENESLIASNGQLRAELQVLGLRVEQLQELLISAERRAEMQREQLEVTEQNATRFAASLREAEAREAAANHRLVKISADGDHAHRRVRELSDELDGLRARLEVEQGRRAASEAALHQKMEELASLREEAAQAVRELQTQSKNEKDAGVVLREKYSQLKAAFTELKARCRKDGDTIASLVAERNDLVREREGIVARFNELYDSVAVTNAESGAGVSDPPSATPVSRSRDDGASAEHIPDARLQRARTMAEQLHQLCTQQEQELQRLRWEGVVLKRSLLRFVVLSEEQHAHVSPRHGAGRMNDSSRRRREGGCELVEHELNVCEGSPRELKKCA